MLIQRHSDGLIGAKKTTADVDDQHRLILGNVFDVPKTPGLYSGEALCYYVRGKVMGSDGQHYNATSAGKGLFNTYDKKQN